MLLFCYSGKHAICFFLMFTVNCTGPNCAHILPKMHCISTEESINSVNIYCKIYSPLFQSISSTSFKRWLVIFIFLTVMLNYSDFHLYSIIHKCFRNGSALLCFNRAIREQGLGSILGSSSIAE